MAEDVVRPNYVIDFEAAAAHAKRFLKGCKKRQKDDLVHLHHAFLQIEQYLSDQVICDPSITVLERQSYMNSIVHNLAFIKLMIATRPAALQGFPAIQEELRPYFKLLPRKVGPEIDVTTLESHTKEFKVEQPLNEREDWMRAEMVDELQRARRI